MKTRTVLSLAVVLAGCNQPVPDPAALIGPSASPVAAESAPAAPAQDLPPIYEPLVDMNKVSEKKYASDLEACRKLAAPQEAVARAAAEREQTGAAVQTMGVLAGYIPIVGASVQTAAALGNASAAAQTVGANAGAGAAMTKAQAISDYALVVNTCLHHRGYILLR
jgi:hypothetical protein